MADRTSRRSLGNKLSVAFSWQCPGNADDDCDVHLMKFRTGIYTSNSYILAISSFSLHNALPCSGFAIFTRGDGR